MKNVNRISIDQYWGIKLGILRSKKLDILQAMRASALSCWKVQRLNCPHKCMKVIILSVFCGYNGKTSTVSHQ